MENQVISPVEPFFSYALKRLKERHKEYTASQDTVSAPQIVGFNSVVTNAFGQNTFHNDTTKIVKMTFKSKDNQFSVIYRLCSSSAHGYSVYKNAKVAEKVFGTLHSYAVLPLPANRCSPSSF